MTTPAQSLEELSERAVVALREIAALPRLAAVQEMLVEAGLGKARHILRDSLGNLAEKQAALRGAQEEERDAKAALEAALVAAEWSLSGCFEVKSNKTWLVFGTDGSQLPEEEWRSLTADEKKSWIATQARKSPEVAAAAARLRSAEHDVANYRDALVIAEKTLGVCRSDLDAAIAHLGALVTALPARMNGEMR